MARTLLDKVWDAHTVRTLPSGQTQLLIGLHLIHEVTTPQAFQMLKEPSCKVRMPERTFATLDHIIPTTAQARPYADPHGRGDGGAHDPQHEGLRPAALRHVDGRQGIVHVIGPELGLTQPGMTIACGDSHTSTHGAVGAIAFGIGTSQVRDVLATQCLAMAKPKLRQVRVDGALAPGVYAKDVILADHPPARREGRRGLRLRVRRARHRAHDDGGAAHRLQHVHRGRRALRLRQSRRDDLRLSARPAVRAAGRGVRPRGGVVEEASPPSRAPRSTTSRASTASAIEPVVTWGINPGQSVGVGERIPAPGVGARGRAPDLPRGAGPHGLRGGPADRGRQDRRGLHRLVHQLAAVGSARRRRGGEEGKVAKGVRALVVPGSQQVAKAAEAEGLHEVFRAAGFEWRKAGCSMCLGMNDDKLQGREMCASSSNRNFIGRQGSPTGRTLLMSPAMVAAAAITGAVADVREMMR